MNQDLGTRMKSYEHNFTKSKLVPNLYAVVRIDGRAFHTFTRGLEKPFDYGLVEDMAATTQYLCKNVQGCHLGYTQSDEISLILFDGHNHSAEKFFDGQLQKICSVVASMTTYKFNQLRTQRWLRDYGKNWSCSVDYDDFTTSLADKLTELKTAEFDARAFSLPNIDETLNYLRWRQRDAVKNSISMVAQSMYSPKSLHGKNGNEQQEMIFQKGRNWNDLNPSVKRGNTIVKRHTTFDGEGRGTFYRSTWEVETPDFCNDEGVEYFKKEVPPSV